MSQSNQNSQSSQTPTFRAINMFTGWSGPKRRKLDLAEKDAAKAVRRAKGALLVVATADNEDLAVSAHSKTLLWLRGEVINYHQPTTKYVEVPS